MVSFSKYPSDYLSSGCTCSSRRAKHGHISFRMARSALELASIFSRDRFNTIITNHLRPTQVEGYVVLIYSTYLPPNSNPASLESVCHDLQYMLDHLGYTHGSQNFDIITDFNFLYTDYQGKTSLVTRREMTKETIGATIHEASHRNQTDNGLIVYGGHAEQVQALRDNGVDVAIPDEYRNEQCTALNPFPDLYVFPWDLRRWLPDQLYEGTKTVLLLDACYIGTFLPAGAVPYGYPKKDNIGTSRAPMSKPGSGALLVLSAAEKDQVARGVKLGEEGKKRHHKHGAFLHTLLEFLSENNRPPLTELTNFLSTRLHSIPQADVGQGTNLSIQDPVVATSRQFWRLSWRGFAS